MTKVHMMIGIPGSGKSYKAKLIAEELNAIYLSSDSIREELYGDENIQIDNQKVFELLHNRLKESLRNGKDVVYDATNSNRKKRIHFIKNEVRGYEVIAHVMLTKLETCVERDNERRRNVGEKVIDRMFKGLHVPLPSEGFSDIEYYIEEFETPKKDEMESALLSSQTYESLYKILLKLPNFDRIYELPQDSTYHSFSVSRHTYYVYEGVFKDYQGENRLEMLWASVLHDLGKGFCKTFYNFKGELQRYANFKQHENVSAYLTVQCLQSLGYEKEFIFRVVELVGFHMMPKNMGKKAEKNLKKWLTGKQYDNLIELNNYDNDAK